MPGMNYENSRTRHRHQPGHGLLPLRGRGHLHADHDRLQRLVQRPVAAVPGLHDRRRLGLYVALGAKNPSTAIGLASFACPFATFYAITSFLRGDQGDMLIVSGGRGAAYGFTTAAMLIPAIYEFDVTTGRTTE